MLCFFTSFIKELLQNDFKLNLGIFFVFSVSFSIIFFILDFSLNNINFLNKDKVIFNLISLNLFFSFFIIFILSFYFLKAYRVFILFAFTFIKVILFYYYLLNGINLKELSKEFMEIVYVSKKDEAEIVTIGDIAAVSFYNLYLNKSEKTISLDIYNYQDYDKILDNFNKNQYIVFLKGKYLRDFEKAIGNNYQIIEIKKVFVVQSEILMIRIIKLAR